MAQTTCATILVWAVLTSLEQMAGRREKEEHLAPLDLSASPQVKRASSLYLQSCKRPRVSHPRTDRAHHCLTSFSPWPAVLPQGHRPSSASVGHTPATAKTGAKGTKIRLSQVLLDELYDETQTYLVWRTWKQKLWGRSFKEQAKGFSRSTQALAPQSGQALTRPGTLRLHTTRLHKRTKVRATTPLNALLFTFTISLVSFQLYISRSRFLQRRGKVFFVHLLCKTSNVL